MILEISVLDIIEGNQLEFENAFKRAKIIIANMKGYISHELQKCIENDHRYLLLVKWVTLQDHTVGFRGSPEYQDWKALLHHFYDPSPVVEHYNNL
ncbi:heme-degrading monooxygenase HmoA [Pedobacter sp. CG_S7]|uniref:antibiotic biosynthesis monooxygenase family protein n=1 Tax=Pedobacter sp. CG_S7 TaxID=3143930 RepID=UPI0033933FA8